MSVITKVPVLMDMTKAKSQTFLPDSWIRVSHIAPQWMIQAQVSLTRNT